MKEICISANDIDWQPAEGYPSGALLKVLHDGSESTPRTFLLKMQPGWMMNAHSHVHTEIHYVVEGSYESQDNVYPEGSLRIIPAHTDHGPFTTLGGAVVLVIGLSELS